MKVIDARTDAARINELFYQRIPEAGLRNYWHPVALSREITDKPVARTLMGDAVVLLRRLGRVYALANACPHRGTQLSKGTCEFPGTRTLTCRYHGWTFDVGDGGLVAALTDGPDSPIVGKLRVRTYPVEERQGIVWIWLADSPPVPVEQDIPRGLLEASEVHTVRRIAKGNWRWHVENPGLGHATFLHRDSEYMRIVDMFGYATGIKAMLGVEGDDDEWLLEKFEGIGQDREYPGLGSWPRHRFGEVIKLTKFAEGPRGVNTIVSVKLPGIIRVSNFPIADSLYYEWFVQTDADHYLYFQVACAYPKTLMDRAYWLLRFYAWGRWAGMVRFNAQDLWMVEDSHAKAKLNGGVNDPVAGYRADGFQLAWRKYALENLRGAKVTEQQSDSLQAAS
ncbi:MAG: aromatic ring-hydroxylating oxygenase subunit alpha [Immundisolibacter sp.]|uniref:aromatic ring-hydroxylating oxygenase subunit alpha n=1 Tax=Immundisolibacter sp. TaxID=1934948 RepID=UPI003EE2F054